MPFLQRDRWIWYWLCLALAWPILAHAAEPFSAGEDGFRGDEIKDRAFDYNREYFTNLLSFGFDKLWLDDWANSPSGYRITAGSIRSSEFYIHQEVKLTMEMLEKTHFKFNFLQAEDFDARYETAYMEMAQDLWNSGFSVAAFGQINPFKENDDIGLAAGYSMKDRFHVRASYLFTDFTFNEKADDGEEYLKAPGTVRLQTMFQPVSRLQIYLDAGYTQPIEFSSVDQDLVFDFKKVFFRSITTFTLREKDQLWLALAMEQTDKNREGMTPGDTNNVTVDRKVFQARLEYIRFLARGNRVTVGLCLLDLDEENDFSNTPTRTRNLRFEEKALYGGFQWHFHENLYFESELFAADVHDREVHLGNPTRTWKHHSIEVKLSTALGWHPRENVRFLLNPTFDLDDGQFGGGNVQLQIVF